MTDLWVEDIPGIKDIIDGTGEVDVPMPRKSAIRLSGPGVVVTPNQRYLDVHVPGASPPNEPGPSASLANVTVVAPPALLDGAMFNENDELVNGEDGALIVDGIDLSGEIGQSVILVPSAGDVNNLPGAWQVAHPGSEDSRWRLVELPLGSNPQYLVVRVARGALHGGEIWSFNGSGAWVKVGPGGGHTVVVGTPGDDSPAPQRAKLQIRGPDIEQGLGAWPDDAGDPTKTVLDDPAHDLTIFNLPFFSRPLSNVFCVDRGTTVSVEYRNGSAVRPYASITEALAARSSIAGPVTLVCTPGSYSSESTITGIGSIAELTIQSMSEGSLVVLPAFNISTGLLTLHRCAIGSYTANQTRVKETTVTGVVTCQALFGLRSSFVTQTGTFISCSGTEVNFDSCFFSNVVRNITFTGSAGIAFFDALSNAHWKAATETITNGTKIVVGDLT
jgi:hypothetical protein